VDRDDLVQAGVIGLIDAARRFDATRQVVFAQYAKHRIKGAILDSLRQNDWASREIRQKHKQAEAAKYHLTATLQRTPTEAEVAEKLGMNVDRWRAIRLDFENISGPVSADRRANHAGDLRELDLPSKAETQPDFIFLAKEFVAGSGKRSRDCRTATKRWYGCTTPRS
jgi:RNA polymerase sigma factor for flagellar operon FliA